MKTILVPIDFSATAKNSALFAVAFAKEVKASRLVLYNAYSMPLATEMSWAVMQTEELQRNSEEGLQEFKAMLLAQGAESLAVDTISDFGFLQERIGEVATDCGADLIVMGITGGGKLEEVLIGSNTTHVINHTRVPVLIVPPDARWRPIRRVGWACDYKQVLTTVPVETIHRMLSLLDASLVVVHNDDPAEDFDADKFHNNVMVSELFSRQQAKFVNLADKDFTHAMDRFMAEYAIDLMLMIPKKHSWFETLFSRSHTTRLAFHTHVPLLCVQAQD